MASTQIQPKNGAGRKTVEQRFNEFSETARAKGYALQPPEELETREMRRQSNEAGRDPDVYQRLVVYIVGKGQQSFNRDFFARTEEVGGVKEQLFHMVCEAMKNGTDVFAFLKHYREFSPEIRQQLELPMMIARVHPHVAPHVSIILGGRKNPYILPDDEDRLPARAFSAEAERLIVGFANSEGLPSAGRIALFDRSFYNGALSPPPRRVISIEEIGACSSP